MVINPVAILFLLYSLANSYAFLLLLNNGGFSAFDNFFKIEVEIAIWAYSIQLFILSTLFLVYKVYSKGKCYKRELENKYGYFLLFITISFFVFNQITGAGRAGTGFSFNGGSLFNIITVVYFISLLSRGWMGSVLLLMIAWLIRHYPVRVNTRVLFYISLLGIITILALPFLDGLKWGMRNGTPFIDIINQVLDKNYFEVLNVVLESVVSRFQNINYASYVLQNSKYFYSSLMEGDFVWFYQAGMLQSIYCKVNLCPIDLNLFSAETIYGESGLTWNIDPGLTGWVSLLYGYIVVFVAFMLGLILLAYRVFNKFYGHQGVLLLACFSYTYFFHGWLGAFYNLILYAFLLSIFVRIRVARRI